MKVLSVFGTRPEAIKLAPLVRELEAQPGIVSRVCVTAQHREMLDQVLEIFHIRPHHDLAIMKKGQSLFDTTVRALSALEGVLDSEQPDVVVVQGDTTTTFAASLAAYYKKVPVAHVEAGLRTGDKHNPFPEEINRRLTDVLTDLYFAPTARSRQNLLAEGVPAERVFVTGNTVIDALQLLARELESPEVARQVEERFFRETGVRLGQRRLVLVTGHRRESFGAGMEGLCQGIRQVARHNEDVEVLYAVHLNPNVQEPVKRILGGEERVHLVPPQDYLTFVWLMNRAHIILTDSGGIQEEAPALGKPVLVARQTTERPEAIEAGVARLVGTDSGTIFRAAQELLDDPSEYDRMARAVNPFGDGKASQRIVDIMAAHLRGKADLENSTVPALR